MIYLYFTEKYHLTQLITKKYSPQRLCAVLFFLKHSCFFSFIRVFFFKSLCIQCKRHVCTWKCKQKSNWKTKKCRSWINSSRLNGYFYGELSSELFFYCLLLLFFGSVVWFGLFCFAFFLACAFTCVFAQDQQKKLGRPKRKLTEALQMLFSARTFQITESQWEVRCRTINEKKKHLHIQTHTQTIAKLWQRQKKNRST